MNSLGTGGCGPPSRVSGAGSSRGWGGVAADLSPAPTGSLAPWGSSADRYRPDGGLHFAWTSPYPTFVCLIPLSVRTRGLLEEGHSDDLISAKLTCSDPLPRPCLWRNLG